MMALGQSFIMGKIAGGLARAALKALGATDADARGVGRAVGLGVAAITAAVTIDAAGAAATAACDVCADNDYR
jgi:hypothetical protein